MALKQAVEAAIEGLRQTFAPAAISFSEDGGGGAHVLVEEVPLGERFAQNTTWIGGHITAQFPHADIYPIFVRGDLQRRDNAPHQAPITPGHTFAGRPAVQISRRSNARDPARETAAMKFLKCLEFLNNA